MKKIRNLIIIFLLGIIIYGLNIFFNVGKSCEFNNGKWLDKYNECADINSQWCENKGGKFVTCSSPCRNNPNATLCVQSCVELCKFD